MNKRGFTLLEMTVVVMVIAILFLLTIPNVAKVIDVVDDKACDALTKVADSAIVQYKLIYGQYPASLNDLVSAGLLSSDQLSCSGGDNLYLSDHHAFH